MLLWQQEGFGVFDQRATDTEFLDQENCDPALAAASYRFMERVNNYFGGVRVVRHFLRREIKQSQFHSPIRILDIGSGSCDIPLALSRWARRRAIPLQITCLEKADSAIDIGRRQLARAGDPALCLLQEDVFTYQPEQPYDYALASMCFHHFSNAQILILLQRLRGFVKSSVLINDLRRSSWATWAARFLLAGTASSAGVRHDALLSIQRGFVISELDSVLRQLDAVTVSISPALWFRVAAVIRYKYEENS